MNSFEVLLAKSWRTDAPDGGVPSYAELIDHLRAVELAGASIVAAVGELILRQLDLDVDEWMHRLEKSLRVACLCHDVGKANEAFQEMVRGAREPRQQPARHELLGALLLVDRSSPLRAWAKEQLQAESDEETELLLNCVIGAVAGHHVKMDENWQKASMAMRGGGCGLELRMLLTNPAMERVFARKLFTTEIGFSLLDGDESFLGDRLAPFNHASNRWRKELQRREDWWRFAAALKALVMAADVAGSAVAPHGEEIGQWVQDTLAGRITAEEMRAVVHARLNGAEPREFQRAVGASRSRVTLVEAGCGTGKTAAAYLWAAHHAEGKKLFFCYPTTGTATEGFLGYVHETKTEAELIHSRAVVDLEGVARTGDEEREDHLLRVKSLTAWGPKVIVCTADTVLALVRNNQRGLYNSPAILSGAFVFDELHAYDDKMLAATVALIRALPGASFLLMSASLPAARKEFLLREIEGVEEIPSPRDLEELPRYELRPPAPIEDAYRAAQEAVADGKRVLWVCNTVARAQKVMRELAGRRVAARNYHSRFKYVDRVRQHRKVIRWFKPEKPKRGIVAVTTQVAEMSLDLDADLLISEVAPVTALIQRLGRLNRRITPEAKGTPRACLLIALSDAEAKPYEPEDLHLAVKWVDKLIQLNRPLRQLDLSEVFKSLAPPEELRVNTHTAWLDSGWHAEQEPVREAGVTVSVILPEDVEACRRSRAEIIKRAIPMNDDPRMQRWREFKGNLLAPEGAIAYNRRTGAVLL